MTDLQWATSIYEAMVHLGINPHDITPNYVDEDTDGNAAIALEEEKVAITFQGNKGKPLSDSGWTVIPLNIADAASFAKIWSSLKEFRAEATTRRSASEMMKTGSKEENILLREIIRSGLPEPDRNYRIMREDGKELTTPDFVWEDVKLAFFMDGLWWHVGKDNREKRKALLEADEKTLKEVDGLSRSRRERDTSNRSELQVLGWRVLECTDTDLSTKAGVREQVDRISRMISTLRKEQRGEGAKKRSRRPALNKKNPPRVKKEPTIEVSELNTEDDLFSALAD